MLVFQVIGDAKYICVLITYLYKIICYLFSCAFHFRAQVDIELFKLLLEHSDTPTVNQLLSNKGVSWLSYGHYCPWLSEPLHKHFLDKANQYLNLKQQEIQSKNHKNLNQLESMNRITEQEAIYENLKNCKNLVKYYTISGRKRSSIHQLGLLNDLDFDDNEKVKDRLGTYQKAESKKVAKLGKNIIDWSKNSKRNNNRNKLKNYRISGHKVWDHLKENGV